MTSRLALVLSTVSMLLLELPFGGIRDASAQIGPNQLPPPGSTGPTKTPEGVAEQAEEDPELLPTTPVLPPIKSKRKRFELVELDGYFRLRTQWLKNLNLGFHDQRPGGAPFPRPLSCQTAEGACGDTLKGANMRLRLEPTININERSKVHFQVDLLDNLVLGSTPAPGALPFVGDSGGQVPPETAGDYTADSILVRRAWAEVETSLGQLTFGRQPWHWGLGILANAGGMDPMHDTYDLNADYGDTVDRVMFRALVPGTDLTAALAMDWAASAPTSAQTGLYPTTAGGQPFDLDDSDDVSQWVVMFSRYDVPKVFGERVARGELALDYGAMVVYRTQEWDTAEPADDTTPLADTFVRRGLKTYTPDAWVKLGWGKLLVEAEALATLGSVDNVADIDPERAEGEGLSFRRIGAVGRVGYRTLADALGLGLELGYASGDRWENQPAGATNVRNARPLPGLGDSTIQAFQFDPNYQVDLILFRELLGAVSNATYVRPGLSYKLTDEIEARLWSVVAMASRRAATPGNDRMYGVEFDAAVAYQSGNFYAGVFGGALFPLAAMSHPADSVTAGSPTFGTESGADDNTGDASNAYTVQSRLAVRF